MDKRQNAFLQMTSALKITCDAHEATWIGFPSFANAYYSFLALFPDVNEAIALQVKSTQGTTKAKNTYRSRLVQRSEQLGLALVQYGKDSGNVALVMDAKITNSMLNKMNEKELVGHAMKLKTLVPLPVPVELVNAPFFITPTFLADYNTDIENFSNAIGTPRHVLAEKMRGTKRLANIIASMRILLDDMDSAAAVLSYSAEDFYNEYETSRSIVDAATMPRSLTVTVVSAESGKPIEGAVAKFSSSKLEKKSGAHGMFFVQNMANRIHTMTVKKAGFSTNTTTFEMDNEGVQLTVMMET